MASMEFPLRRIQSNDIMLANSAVADPDLQISGRPYHPDPAIRGGGGGALLKIIFRGPTGLYLA